MVIDNSCRYDLTLFLLIYDGMQDHILALMQVVWNICHRWYGMSALDLLLFSLKQRYHF